jgi:predicted phosphohydrolase
MLIRLFSDLHAEIDRADGNDIWIPPHLDTDKDTILILAGDIDSKGRIKKYAESLAERFRYVLYVAGNHEYYGTHIDKDMRSDIENVIFMENETIEIDDVIFFGATLWTDFNDLSYTSVSSWVNYMADSRAIRDLKTGKTVSAQTLAKRHSGTVARIKEEIANKGDKKLFVITHHSPSFINESPLYVGNVSSAFFHSNLDELVCEVDRWVFGHTHHNVDHHGMKSNQRGYVNYESMTGFNEEGFVTI